MARTAASSRYSAVAIILHWLIAAAVLSMLPMGWWMADAISDPARQQTAFKAYQLHKSIGFTILGLTLLRLAWRISHPTPPLSADMPVWERFGARATHWAFYALLLALPITGWAYVSSGWAVSTDKPLNVATVWFGLIQVPHLSFVADQPAEMRRLGAYSAMGAHATLALGAAGLIALHVAAALKHQFHNRDNVLPSMVPWLELKDEGPAASGGRLAMAAGVGAIAVLLFAGGMLASPPAGGAPRAEAAQAAPTAPAEPIVPGTAKAWTVDRAGSAITFSGTHAGAAFNGRFDDWEGHIWFDPDNLSGSKAVVLVRTASARTGDATQEGSLVETEWLNPKAFPIARFETQSFRSLGGDHYEATGTLRVKARTVPVVLPFILTLTDGQAKVTGALELDRMALDLGLYSDPSADWVSKMIGLEISVTAH
ncbi:cytochrome b/b6 domain-containing protein [Phenylobacterium immobile]|uniref:cytochrome b/b6 domain-containing protein n=1 Tax=Phenylobacterium immobile TaxID=21 RepID=UPI000A5710C2|nr:cytochrome b/b6 domain-containing protein [Phenylobacterium immobile]